MKKKHLKCAVFVALVVCITTLLQVTVLLHVNHQLLEQLNKSVPETRLEFRAALKPTDDFVAYQHWHALDRR